KSLGMCEPIPDLVTNGRYVCIGWEVVVNDVRSCLPRSESEPCKDARSNNSASNHWSSPFATRSPVRHNEGHLRPITQCAEEGEPPPRNEHFSHSCPAAGFMLRVDMSC